MRRICCFCEKWESGGIESFLCNVITHMDLRGLEIHIIASVLDESLFTTPLERLGVQFHQLSGSQRNLLKNRKMLRELLNRYCFDVIHLNIFHGLSLRYAKLAEQVGVPTRIAHSHNTSLRKTATRKLKLLVHNVSKRLYTKYATDFWACSGAAAEFLFPAKYVRQYCFIPNGIEIERFRFSQTGRDEARRELGLRDEFLIGNVGRLCEQKNQRFLLEVFAEVIKTRPDARLILVGEGELRGELEAQAAQLGVSDYVIFYGLCDNVERLLWAMDVFVFPSLFEGLGIVAVEAQAAGLPVVCSEFVPAEAVLTDRTERYALDKDIWGKKLSDVQPILDREQWAEQICVAVYNVAHTADQIQCVYTAPSESYT